MFRKIMSTTGSWVPLPLRLALAAVFIAHGAGKVLGSWSGPGLANFTSFPPPFPFMRPGWLWMGAAALSELIGGALLLLGLLTRVGAFLLACTMAVAIAGPHWGHFFAPSGFEYPMTLLAMCLALLISGGGMASVDRSLSSGRRR